jgi:hypothetical protein
VRARLTIAGAGLAAATLMLSGCGGSSSPDATATPPTTVPGSAVVGPGPTAPAVTLAPEAPDAADATMTESEVAQIEQQLDEIDQLLNDLDVELAAD